MTSSRNMDVLRAQLIEHEGLRLFPYTDSVGKVSIGVGRNLSDRGISNGEAMLMLDHDMYTHVAELLTALPWVAGLDDVRFRVLAEMAFNLGVPGLVKFRTTLAYVKAGKYAKASEQMLKSLWARQVKRRAITLARQMATGAL